MILTSNDANNGGEILGGGGGGGIGNESLLNPAEFQMTENKENFSGDQNLPPPQILRSQKELERHLELMHDRCISRNLKAAGLGGVDNEDDFYGRLDANAEMETGESLLIATIQRIHDEEKQARFVAILLNEGADSNIPDAFSKTPLMISIIKGYERTAKLLLNSKLINFLATDSNGNTGLHYAAAMGNEQILKRYVKAIRKQRHKVKDLFGWNSALKEDDFLNLRNKDEQTPRNLALNAGHLGCVKVIDDEQMKGLRDLGNRLRMMNHLRRLSPTGLRQQSANIHRHSSFDNLLHVDRDEDDEENLLAKSDVSNFGRSIQMLKGQRKYSSVPEKIVLMAANRPQTESISSPNSSKTDLQADSVNKQPKHNPKLSLPASYMPSKSEMMREVIANPMNEAAAEAGEENNSGDFPNIPAVQQRTSITQRIKRFFQRKPPNRLSRAISEQNMTHLSISESSPSNLRRIDSKHSVQESHRIRPNSQESHRIRSDPQSVPALPPSLSRERVRPTILKTAKDELLEERATLTHLKNQINLPPLKNARMWEVKKEMEPNSPTTRLEVSTGDTFITIQPIQPKESTIF